MSIDERLLLAHDLERLAIERRRLTEDCFSRAERALWVKEVVRACEAALPQLPGGAEAVASKMRWALDVYSDREARGLTADQRRTWADQAARTMNAAASSLKAIAEQPARAIDMYMEYNEAFHAGRRYITPKGRARPSELPPLAAPAEHEKSDPRSGWRPGRKNVPRGG